MPNWNSWTMPVTTPMAMLIRKSLPQNFVALRYFSFSRAHPGGLQAGGERGERDRQGDEEEVVDGGDAELPSRQGLRRQS